MKKKILIILLVLILLVFIFIMYLFVYPPIKINLVGDSHIYLGLDEEYIEPGYNALFIGEDLTSNIITSGDVDTSKVGQYKISYTLKKGIHSVYKERIIDIVDDIKPELSLIGPSYIYLYKGKEYKEYGYNVSDNYDEEVKVNIKSNIDINTVGKYEVKYTAIDSSNNQEEIIRTVEVVDKAIATDVPVLMYHFFYDASAGQKQIDSNYTEVKAFEEQIKYLVENNYYFPTWAEVNDYMDGIIALPEKSIVLTFDDGASTFYDLAYPVISRYNVPVTVFAITSWGRPDIEYFSLVSFQSHSHNMHRGGCQGGHGGIFQCLDYDDALADLKLSQEMTNGATIFCYPFGDVNDREVELLKEANFAMAFTTEWGRIRPGMDKYRLPRVRVSGGISLNYFINITS